MSYVAKTNWLLDDVVLPADMNRIEQGISDADVAVSEHLLNLLNPHGTTKAQVGLSEVANYGVASQAQAEAGTVSDKYMTPERTKQAINTLQAVKSVAGKTGTVALGATDISLSNANFTSTNVNAGMTELFTNVSNGKTAIASAITGMGQSATGSDSFATLATKISDISDDATAAAGDVLATKTFYQGGSKKTGTIPSKGAQTFTPGTTNQTIAAGQYLSGVQTIAGDADLISSNIRAGVNIFGVAGNSNVVDTSAGDATAAQIIISKKAYVDGQLLTGTLKNRQTSVPAAPTLSSRTFTSITLNSISGCEYRRDSGAWQSSTVFSGLTAGKAYSFSCRYAETSTHFASDPSSTSIIYTLAQGEQTFTTSGTFIVPGGVTSVQVAVVAGGGAGGHYSNLGIACGGGGGGGVKEDLSVAVTEGQSISVVVGAGGVAGVNGVGGTGGNSSFGSIVANGGGYGGRYYSAYVNGGNGGCGGGAPQQGNSAGSGPGTGISGQGYAGGASVTNNRGGGGGGGSGAIGGASHSSGGGNGGAGKSSTVLGYLVAGGGGGGGQPNFYCGSGTNGGGKGADENSPSTAGTPSTGGGGGGGGADSYGNPLYGSPGGSGIVKVRWGY